MNENDRQNGQNRQKPLRSGWDIALMIIVPAVLAIALLVVGIWGSNQSALAAEYKRNSETMYRRTFTELADDFSELTVTLGKLRVAGSPAQYVLLLDDVWRLCGSGVSLMSRIPSYHVDTVELNRFVVQLGDYARSLTKKALKGSPLNSDDMAQLDELYAKCAELSSELSQRVADGDMPLEVVASEDYYTSESGEYEDDESISEFPTLIYDGPFAESVEKLEPRGLPDGDVTLETAQTAADAAAGVTLNAAGEAQGSIPSYDFEGKYDDGRTVYVSITKQGGRLLYMMSSATGDAEGLPEQSEAKRFVEAAQQYLEQNGYSNMQPTYAQYYSGAALINFAATQDGVILYNDLVKLWVDRSTLGIVGVDARNYLFSHTERELPAVEITVEEAEQCLSIGLNVQARALALIPLTPETEALCYEFKGTVGEGDGAEEYIVYINAVNGDEEQIFRIINSDDGQSVI